MIVLICDCHEACETFDVKPHDHDHKPRLHIHLDDAKLEGEP